MTDKEREELEELQVHLWNAYELINDILNEYPEEFEEKVNWRGLNGRDEIAITRYLQKIGISPLANGYVYLKEAIKITIEDVSACYNITKKVYPLIAKTNNATEKSVARAIENAIKSAFKKQPNNKFREEVFAYLSQEPTYIPSNAEFIIVVADRVKMQKR